MNGTTIRANGFGPMVLSSGTLIPRDSCGGEYRASMTRRSKRRKGAFGRRTLAAPLKDVISIIFSTENVFLTDRQAKRKMTSRHSRRDRASGRRRSSTCIPDEHFSPVQALL